MKVFNRVYAVVAAAVVMGVIAPIAGATGFDVTALTGQTQTTWLAAIGGILSVVGLFLGAKVAIKWAMRLLAR
jgi:uncharacterized membrane protein